MHLFIVAQRRFKNFLIKISNVILGVVNFYTLIFFNRNLIRIRKSNLKVESNFNQTSTYGTIYS